MSRLRLPCGSLILGAIFINYRREDTLRATGRITEALVNSFSTGEVFRDLQDIEAGADFRTSLADKLRAARVVIVVNGPSWLRPPWRESDRVSPERKTM